MYRSFVLIAITSISGCLLTHSHEGMSIVAEALKKSEIVSHVINKAPPEELKVTFGNLKVHLGNVLTPTEVKDMPRVQWTADANSYYVLAMTDPDVPSRQNHTWREVDHWLVGNIPGDNVNDGYTLTEFLSSASLKGTGFHRYVLMVYKQNGKIEFEDPFINNRTLANRLNFSSKRFADKYVLGNPVAGNFYRAEYDDYVPIVLAQLGYTSD